MSTPPTNSNKNSKLPTPFSLRLTFGFKRQRSEIHTHELEIELLRQDIEDYRDLKTGKSSNLKDEYRKRSEQHEKDRKPAPKRDKSRDRGHEPEI